MKAIVAVVLLVVGVVLGILARIGSIMRRAAPVIIAVLFCIWLVGCTTNVTIDNSVIDQSDVTQVLGCATDSVYELGE